MRNTDLDQDIANMRLRVLPFCLKIAKNPDKAEDLVHTTILHAMEKEHQFKRGTNLFSWMCRIAQTMWWWQFLYKHRYEIQSGKLDEWAIEELYTEPHQETYLMLKEIVDAVATEKQHHRALETTLAAALNNDNYVEIAEEFKIPRNTVKTRVFRGRHHLEEMGL